MQIKSSAPAGLDKDRLEELEMEVRDISASYHCLEESIPELPTDMQVQKVNPFPSRRPNLPNFFIKRKEKDNH